MIQLILTFHMMACDTAAVPGRTPIMQIHRSNGATAADVQADAAPDGMMEWHVEAFCGGVERTVVFEKPIVRQIRR